MRAIALENTERWLVEDIENDEAKCYGVEITKNSMVDSVSIKTMEYKDGTWWKTEIEVKDNELRKRIVDVINEKRKVLMRIVLEKEVKMDVKNKLETVIQEILGVISKVEKKEVVTPLKTAIGAIEYAISKLEVS